VLSPTVIFFAVEFAAFALPLAAAAVAFQIGLKHRARAADPAGDPHLATIEASTLGLLALLVAFALSMAQDRWEVRRNLIVEEADAIVSAHMRAGLLPAPAEAEARRLLSEYVDARMEFFAANDRAAVARAEERAHTLQASLSEIATSEGRAHPTPPTALFVSAINEIVDLDEKRLSSLETHLPATIVVLLFAVAMVACVAVAYASAWSGRRSAMSLFVVPLLVGAALLVVVDLDKPRLGIIRVSNSPIERLQDSLHGAPPHR
jgi:hypothetical protein